MDTLDIALFGGFQLRRGERSVPPMPSRAARSLLAYLAIDRGVAHPRERLAGRFWPDLPANRARRRLSHTLWQVQDALSEVDDGGGYLEVTADTLAFSADAPCTIDVERFENGLDRVPTRRGGGGDRVRDLTELEAIVGLYRGEFLAGHTEEWVVEEQDRLHLRYVEALGWLVALAKEHGAYADALVYARRLTNEDPLREDAHREVMRLSVLQGRVGDALRQYDRCKEVLADELGTGPSAATRQLVERIRQRRHLAVDPVPDQPTTVARVPLVGRQGERDLGITVLERCLAGRGGVLLIEGEPGIGTSRLLEELRDDAEWRGFQVARVAAPIPERARAFGLAGDLVEQLLTPLRLEQLRPQLAPVWLAEAGGLLPALQRLVPGGRPPAGGLHAAERAQRMQDALVQLLLASTTIDPIALVVDDAHWCDRESLAVLEVLASQLDDRRLLLAVGYRGDEARADDHVWDTFRSIDRRARPERTRLTPLDVFSCGELVRSLVRGRAIAPDAVARLHRETGGNPLFIVETVRSLDEDGALGVLAPPEVGADVGPADRDGTGATEPAALPLPRSIRELVTQRLERLDPEGRAVLDLAAVAGGELDVGTLVTASDLPHEVVVAAADRLVRRQLLAQTATGLAFKHDQLRRAVMAELQPGAYRAINARLAGALEAAGTDAPQQLAHHFIEAGLVARAGAYLRRAARDAAAVHAYATADRYYQQARDQAVGPMRVAERFLVLAEHEKVLDVLGARDRQAATLDELQTLAEPTPEHRIEVARRRALLLGQLGEAEPAVAAAAAALEAAERLDDQALLGSVLLAQASVLSWAGRRELAVEVFERIMEVAPGTEVAVQAQVQLGSVLRELQRYDDARAVLESVLAVAVGRGVAREEAVALGALGSVQVETGDSDAAIELYGRAIERSVAIGFRRAEGVNRVNRAVVAYRRGDVGRALEDLSLATEVFQALGDRRGEAAVALNLGHIRHVVLGDDVVARRRVESALSFFREIGDHTYIVECRDTLASIALAAGDVPEARHQLEATVVDGGPALDYSMLAVPLTRRRAQLAAAAGDLTEASDLLAEALASAREEGLADLVPALEAERAELLASLGEPQAALRAGARAVDALHAGVEQPYLVRAVHGRLLADAGRRSAARQVVELAAEELRAALASLVAVDLASARAHGPNAALSELAARLEPRRVSVTVAAAEAPLGRSLEPADRREFVLELPERDELDDDPVRARRELLVGIVEDLSQRGGCPTVDDLAGVLDVSAATVRRDLAALRAGGRRVVTRGSRSG